MTNEVVEEPFEVVAADGVAIASRLYRSGDTTGAATIIAGAVGVPQGFYRAFARHLAVRGRPVVTFDWRGIGRSLHGPIREFRGELRDWGQRDAPAVIEEVRRRYPHRRLHWIGHSYGGGFAIALAANSHLIDRHLGIATPHAYWRDMSAPERYRIAVLMRLFLPATVRLAGYVPGRLSGFGEDLPGGVAREWARWILHPDSMFGVLPAQHTAPAAQFRAPMCFFRFADDPWATARDTERIMARFPAAVRSIRVLGPVDAGGQKIGHMGFFRSRFADTLWPQAVRWLDEEIDSR
jgi:predicted alpha/beta hydrolase